MLNWLPRQDIIFVVTTTYPNVFDVAIFNTQAEAMRTAYNVANDIERTKNGQDFYKSNYSSFLEIIESEDHVIDLNDGTQSSLGPQFEVLYNVYLDYSNDTYAITVQLGKL